MANVEKNEVRENRIVMEIVVDAYNPEEQAMGWYYYLDDNLAFPFQAKCISDRRSSPIKAGATVEVIDMAPEEECLQEMMVEIRWDEEDTLAIPLAQLQPIDTDEQTMEAVADWHYWVAQGYELG